MYLKLLYFITSFRTNAVTETAQAEKYYYQRGDESTAMRMLRHALYTIREASGMAGAAVTSGR